MSQTSGGDGGLTVNDETYTCPLSEEQYRGICPCTACPANVQTRKSGCVHNFLHKREVGLADLAYVFDISLKDVKLRIEQGKTAIQLVLLLNDLLTRLRDNNKATKNCVKCGIFRTSPGGCFNQLECDSRKRLTASLLTRAPFSIPEFHFTKADIFLLIANRGKINEYLATLDTETRRIRFSTLLSLNKQELAEIREVKTLV